MDLDNLLKPASNVSFYFYRYLCVLMVNRHLCPLKWCLGRFNWRLVCWGYNVNSLCLITVCCKWSLLYRTLFSLQTLHKIIFSIHLLHLKFNMACRIIFLQNAFDRDNCDYKKWNMIIITSHIQKTQLNVEDKRACVYNISFK